MAKNRVKRRKRKFNLGSSLILLALVALIAFLYPYLTDRDTTPDGSDNPIAVDGQIAVHVIDVGQGDAILITTPDGNMLIDAGDNTGKSESALAAYLDEQGVTELEYFIATHVHADHIGGADMVLNNYKVNNVIMTDAVTTTGVFNSMMDAIESSGATVIEAVAGNTFALGDLRCRILAPLNDYSNTNDQSIVLRVTWGNVSMLFTGDAEGNLDGNSEKDMLTAYSSAELQADFYKVGHHGSDTSNSTAFLKAVAPKLAAISCGEGNKYGHPIASVLDTLQALDITFYRTDLDGDLVFLCDGESIWYRK